MCGRYVLDNVEDLSERYRLDRIAIRLAPTYNAAPSQRLPVVLVEPDGERRIAEMHWGLIPRWRKPGGPAIQPTINARAETVLEKPMFRSLVPKRRCLVPATGFYEWKQDGGKGKQPYFVRSTDQPIFSLAGLWDESKGDGDEPVRSFTILTTSPNELVATLHHRMAAMLDPADEEEWLDPGTTDGGIIERVIRPYPAAAMEAYPVGREVNNTRNDGPHLIERLEAQAPLVTGD